MEEHRTAIIVGSTIVIVVGLALVLGYSYFGSGQAATAPLAEISGRDEIQNTIQMSHLGIATSENFVGQRIRVIEGNLKNVSAKPVRMIEVKLVYTDYDGKPVHEYAEKVLQPRQRPLAPSEEFRFEIREENLPRTWNYHVPIAEVTKIAY